MRARGSLSVRCTRAANSVIVKGRETVWRGKCACIYCDENAFEERRMRAVVRSGEMRLSHRLVCGISNDVFDDVTARFKRIFFVFNFI